jgi:broad specificity phosphatase PhoE
MTIFCSEKQLRRLQMEFIFIRHGQGEHTLDLPNSLQIADPALTKEGIKQARFLREQFPLSEKDILVISPIRRTLQTALYWSEDIKCTKIVSPLVSPRMFPQNPAWRILPCDMILDKEKIKIEFPNFQVKENLPSELWSDGINTMPENKFKTLAENFIEWCKKQSTKRIFIVSHDGTITSYRQIISGKNLTRDDFPKETGWFQISC